MALRYLLILMCCLVMLGGADAASPGAVVRITQNGLDYASQKGIGALQQKLSSFQLSDYSGSYDMGALGNINYEISGMATNSIQLPNSQIAIVPNVGLNASIDQASIEVQGHWSVEHPIVSDSGDFNLQITGISISVGLQLRNDGSGKLIVTTSDCNACVEDMKVHFTDTIDWLVKLFDDTIASSLKENMQSEICPEVVDLIKEELEPVLQSLQISVELDDVATIDYSLMGSPCPMASNLDVKMKAEVFETAQRATPPFSPPSFSLPDEQDLMVYYAVSEYLFNTALFVYQSAGKLVFSVTDDMIPESSPMRLSTSSFGTIIPELAKMCPNMLMKLDITSNCAPSVSITPEIVSMVPRLDIQAYAILPNSSLAPLFLLDLKADVSADVTVNSSRIVGELKLNGMNLELKHSDIEPFSVDLIENTISCYLSNTLLPEVNGRSSESIKERQKASVALLVFSCLMPTETPATAYITHGCRAVRLHEWPPLVAMLARDGTAFGNSVVLPFPLLILCICLCAFIFFKMTIFLLCAHPEILSEGYPLPLLDNMQLENVIVKQYENYLLIGADVNYLLPKSPKCHNS